MKERSPHVIAQNEARKYLLNKYRKEYDAFYRAKVIELGGKVAPTTEEKIAHLKAEIARLEASNV
jgi:hypothetical protein